MDPDDPEKRIAELERQLAQARRSGGPPGAGLTAQQVHEVAFNKPPIGKRGYNEDQVDGFLDLVEAALRDPAGRTLTAEQVRAVRFAKPPIGQRGYNEDEVDAFLEVVEAQLRAGPTAATAVSPAPAAQSHARDPSPESKGRRFINGVIDIARWITD